MTTNMSGTKEFVLVCVVFLVISCLVRAQPTPNQEAKSSDGLRRKDPQPQEVSQLHNSAPDQTELENRPRIERSVPYLGKFMEKVNQKAIRSPSLRLRFGRRSDPDFPPNFDLLNEDFQREDPQQMLSPMDSVYQQKRFLGFARQERKPARLRWGRSAPGQFSSARDQVQDTMEALARAQRSKTSRLRWGRSGPMSYTPNEYFRDLSDSELASLAIQYLINNQQREDQYAPEADVPQQTAEEESIGKN